MYECFNNRSASSALWYSPAKFSVALKTPTGRFTNHKRSGETRFRNSRSRCLVTPAEAIHCSRPTANAATSASCRKRLCWELWNVARPPASRPAQPAIWSELPDLRRPSSMISVNGYGSTYSPIPRNLFDFNIGSPRQFHTLRFRLLDRPPSAIPSVHSS